ncbi:MAG: hypothetical protein AB7S75_16890 [Desulfococcaceae bacterium]
MKCHQFWIKEKREIRVGNDIKVISLLIGSDISKEDALEKADKAALNIESKIRDRRKTGEYESEIKEFVYHKIDDKNIVTVNRYGALVLNTCQYTVLDIDDYSYEFSDLFRFFRSMTKKDRIISRFRKKLDKYPELGDSFRIYETCKGVRIIGNKYYDPDSPKFESRLRQLFVDWIYIVMCRKQKCYRARLTPKPYRMKINTVKIKSPTDCESEAYQNWFAEYQKKASEYSVVRLRETAGSDFSMEPAIKYHDAMSGLDSGKKLA